METYSVLRELKTEINIQKAAAVIGAATLAAAADMLLPLKKSPGILCAGLRKTDAERIVQELRDMNMPVFSMRDADLVTPPAAIDLKAGKVRGDGFAFDGPEGAMTAAWDKIIVIEAGQIKKSKQVTKIESKRPARYTSMAGGGMINASGGGGVVRRTHTEMEYTDLFDIICYEPWLHLRINKATFQFAQTGLPRHPTREANFTGFVVVFKARCTNAISGEGVELLFDGKPATRSRTASKEAFENHLLWLTQLRFRKG
jgi:hypothetical protein